ncbi:hypothetical protein PHLCEN_2v6081 [Hermanssonia centrifuga]|uniref:Uncharacterized protein n=1 Tax=Hermanssonia centrifuga TaxID=98765 RepID=A0A2R6P0G8_9APHY|nr:hypothetical protein PHLCEN_2v6081 [Hermanssonia centrifuga]
MNNITDFSIYLQQRAKATQTRQTAILANLEADASEREAAVYEEALRDYEEKNAGRF